MRKLIILLVALLAVWNVALTMNLVEMKKDASKPVETNYREISTEFQTDYTELIDVVRTKVVGIVSHGAYSDTFGSGVIYGKADDGGTLVVTNAHIVSSNEVSVFFANREEVKGTVLGRDPLSDIALLIIYPEFNIEAFTLGNSRLVKEGEWVLTSGCRSSLDYNGFFSEGIVSSVNRTTRKYSTEAAIYDYDMNLIQTTAGVDSAISGGALVNMNGELIGIVNSSAAVFSSESSSIEINEVKLVVEQLLSGEEIHRTLTGFFAKDLKVLPLYLKSAYQVDIALESGLVVTDVSADSMAAKAGLLIGDVITKINDIDMDSYQTYREWMYHNAEKQLTLEVHRGLDTLKLILTVEEPPVAETVND